MKILVVEDDKTMAEMVKIGLSSDSHTVEVAYDGADGSFLARSYDYDALVLDYSLPKKDGLTVCREIREAGKSTPIIFISITDDVPLKIAALNCGADDYVTKPFALAELRARVKAVIRRPNQLIQPIFQVADLVLNSEKQTVHRGKDLVHLTRKEFNLLEYLMRNVGIILSRVMIMEHVWTADSDPLSNTVEAHIRNLRKKLKGKNKANLIINVPGRGYLIDMPEKLKKLYS